GKLSAREIGARLGVSKDAIIGKAHRLGWPARQSPVARQPGAARPPVYWTPERDDELRALIKDGRTSGEAAEAMGVTPGAVMGRIKILARTAPVQRTQDRAARLLDWIRREAAQHRAAPTNGQIVAAYHVSQGEAAHLISRLIRRGLIVVESRTHSRRISAPDGSWQTAWSQRAGIARAAPVATVPHTPAAPAKPSILACRRPGEAMKANITAGHRIHAVHRKAPVPPPPNADALVAEFLARKGATQCPTAGAMGIGRIGWLGLAE
ncbi:GcrA family cell cycle regulator, partial [Roseomonas sp. NAR14]